MRVMVHLVLFKTGRGLKTIIDTEFWSAINLCSRKFEKLRYYANFNIQTKKNLQAIDEEK
jgi:hypothetical protein